MLNDCLRTAQLDWKDITVVWTDDVSGDKGPAALFRKDASIDGCFAISPEMTDLTGGLESTGDGQDEHLAGAHVVVSTAYMSRSIADVYACRADFYAGNKDWVQKFAAGYLKSCEDLVDAKKKAAPAYKAAIHLAQDIWGKDPALKDTVAKEDDVDGLISDSTFVGLPGNITFFTSKGNLTGLPVQAGPGPGPAGRPGRRSRSRPIPPASVEPDLDYDALRKLGDLNGKAITQGRIKAEFKFDDVKENTIYSFTIGFEREQFRVPGGAIRQGLPAGAGGSVAVRQHRRGDPRSRPAGRASSVASWTPAKKSGLLKYNAATGAYTFADGKPLDLNNMQSILDAINKNPELQGTDQLGPNTGVQPGRFRVCRICRNSGPGRCATRSSISPGQRAGAGREPDALARRRRQGAALRQPSQRRAERSEPPRGIQHHQGAGRQGASDEFGL